MNTSIALNLVEIIVAKLRELDDTGSCDLGDGTLLLRKLPPRRDGLFSEAYSHEIFSGLTSDEIDRLEANIQRKLPPDLRSFYRQANGLSLFSESLLMKGLQNDYSRLGSARLPISLEYGNVLDRPIGIGEEDANQVRFGFFSAAEGAEVAMTLDGDRAVYAYPSRQLAPVLYRWPDLETFLLSEVDRMIAAFKARNGDVDPFNPIEPPWQSA